MRRRSVTPLLLLLLAAGLTAACSDGPSTSAPARASATPTPDLSGDLDASFTVNGKQLHAVCVGKGAPTVVLVAGFGEDVASWVSVRDDLAAHTRVCAYDRPGTGASAFPTEDQTFASEAADLHGLLDALQAPAPYVLVGHSLGGGLAVQFASSYRDETGALLLLDATPVGWLEVTRGIPGQLADGYVEFTQPSRNQERFDGLAAFAEVARITTLGDLPVIVDNASRARDGIAPDAASQKRVEAAWDAGQRRWAGLSTRSRLQVVDSGHFIQQDKPDVVLAQVAELVRQVG